MRESEQSPYLVQDTSASAFFKEDARNSAHARVTIELDRGEVGGIRDAAASASEPPVHSATAFADLPRESSHRICHRLRSVGSCTRR